LVALYESWFYPLVRLCAVPLGLVGAFVALWVTQNTLNIFSIIGLIMAEGLVAKNGILLIDYTNQLRQRGLTRLQALAEAARVRLRPILMTSATLVFGLMPLALKLEAGAESRAPTAVVVIGAILSSTVLTLLVIPSIYTLFDDLQAFVTRKVRRAPAVVPAPALAVAGAAVAGEGSSPLNGARSSPDTTGAPATGRGNGQTNGASNGHAKSNGSGRPFAGLRARLRGGRTEE
jgi:HAE1 family hydrophobic/amphiphilic exporter-1